MMGAESDNESSEFFRHMPIRVLTIEDDVVYRSLIKGYLGASGVFDVAEADTLACGLVLIEHLRPDAILVDLGLPDARGLDVFHAIAAVAGHTPIIMLTAEVGHTSVVEAMSQGAADYLIKGEDRTRKIGSVIRRAVETALVRRQQAEVADAVRREQAALSLLSIVSHELRTPLHGILAFAGLGLQRIDKGNPDIDALKDYFKEIVSAGKHLLGHATDLTDLHRIEQGSMAADKRKVNIVDVIRNVCLSMKYLFEERGHLLSVEGDEKDIVILGDPFLIGRAVRNLLINAATFSGDDTKIDICIRQSADTAEIVILDNGIGIPEAELGNIFDKFWQGSNVPTNSGMGLGLAVCREIVTMHHGTITAKRRDGVGTEFKVFLPIYVENTGVSDD
jgi:signal transduction histidine kinase